MTEYQACYVFSPVDSEDTLQRPSKRRKTKRVTELAKDDPGAPFVPLLRGIENQEGVQLRNHNFQAIWRPKGNLIDERLRLINDDIVSQIVSFVLEQDVKESNCKLSTGLIIAGPDNSKSIDFQCISERVNFKQRAVLVQLTSGLSPNLKTILKYINQHAKNQVNANDEDLDGSENKNGRQLNYDLQMLYDYGRSHSVHRVILAFEDSEAFETTLLTELIDVLSSWNDRIPFVLLFNIATSIRLFQGKLSRETIRRLSAIEFQVGRVDTDDIFRDLQHQEPSLFFGPAISYLMLRQHHDFIQSPAAFAQTLKYSYMTHFFANPLSILLCENPSAAPLQKEHYEAIRNLPSFRIYAQALIDDQSYDAVRDMLGDDGSLNETVMREVVSGRNAVQDILSVLKILCNIQSYPTNKTKASWSELYVQAMSGSLLESAIFNDIVSSIKKLPSDAMEDLVTLSRTTAALSSDLVNALASIKTDLAKLISTLPDRNTALRSAYETHHSTLRTTVVAQKVSLSKNSSKMSSQDSTYTNIVDHVYDALNDHMRRILVNPQKLFLNEVLIYDLKSPHREVFTPNPRFAVERALSSPYDYLGCECCSSAKQVGLEASQPATAILYQLYLESGAIINTADLWEAFWTIVGGEIVEDEEGERERALALFSRALADLKYMGMIKNSRKKADHITKLAWQGL